MKIEVNSNAGPLELTVKEVRNYVFPRFKNIPNGRFKISRWLYKEPTMSLYYRKEKDVVRVGFMVSGHGIPTKWYTMDELEALMMPF